MFFTVQPFRATFQAVSLCQLFLHSVNVWCSALVLSAAFCVLLFVGLCLCFSCLAMATILLVLTQTDSSSQSDKLRSCMGATIDCNPCPGESFREIQHREVANKIERLIMQVPWQAPRVESHQESNSLQKFGGRSRRSVQVPKSLDRRQSNLGAAGKAQTQAPPALHWVEERSALRGREASPAQAIVGSKLDGWREGSKKQPGGHAPNDQWSREAWGPVHCCKVKEPQSHPKTPAPKPKIDEAHPWS